MECEGSFEGGFLCVDGFFGEDTLIRLSQKQGMFIVNQCVLCKQD